MLQRVAAQDIYDRATQSADGAFVPMLAGQSMGLIHDLPSAAEVVNALMSEAERILARLA
jgi:NAD(P)H-dependent flavin oxidoreductase YrpB (nitropropane dioxygenase family)